MQALFKWEDSPALKHHCGVCQKPLHHPSAISSCYGPHAEPCHRFHQGLFMLNRAHTCAACRMIDEEHHKRHREIAIQIHAVYDSAGESEWSIIPPELPELPEPEAWEDVDNPKNPEATSADNYEAKMGLVVEAKPALSKREKSKATKRLAKAAAKAKLHTQKDTDYGVDDLGATSSDNNEIKPDSVTEAGPAPWEQEKENTKRLTANVDETGPDPTLNSKPALSKRERKNNKRLAKAAKRAKLVTQKDINYINQVIHLTKSPPTTTGDDPRNLDEVESIERQIRYNAKLYSLNPKQSDRKVLASIPSIDVDLNADMNNIQSVLRVNELSKRNTPTGGLRGKELKKFEKLVSTFRMTLLEDLVLVHKDNLECRMRRAGYLRYVSKGAYNFVADRYPDMDWRQGGKIVPISSNTSPELVRVGEASSSRSDHKKQSSFEPPLFDESDIRHIEHTHTRVAGDDGVEDPIIEPHETPVLPTKEDLTPQNKLKSLRIVDASSANAMPDRAGTAWGKKHTRNFSLSSDREKVSSPQTGRVEILRQRGNESSVPSRKPWMDNDLEFPGLPPSRNLTYDSARTQDASTQYERKIPQVKDAATQTPRAVVTWLDEPAVTVAEPVVEQPQNQPGPSLKKQNAKKEREAKRKAKKNVSQAEHEDKVSSSGETFVGEEQTIDGATPTIALDLADQPKSLHCIEDEDVLKDHGKQVEEVIEVKEGKGEVESVLQPAAVEQADKMKEAKAVAVKRADQVKHEAEAAAAHAALVSRDFNNLTIPESSEPSATTISQGCKHMDWFKFTKYFIVDQITSPKMAFMGDDFCAFLNEEVRDCPFHEPYTDMDDPLAQVNMCYLVYPGISTRKSGALNRLHAKRLLAHYEACSLTAGKLMLLDSDIYEICTTFDDIGAEGFITRHTDKWKAFALATMRHPHSERLEMLDTYTQMCQSNGKKEPVSRETLQDLEDLIQPPEAETVCYCRMPVPSGLFKADIPEDYVANDHELVLCWYKGCEAMVFHRQCVEHLGVELLSRWYCTACAKVMKEEAKRAMQGARRK